LQSDLLQSDLLFEFQFPDAARIVIAYNGKAAKALVLGHGVKGKAIPDQRPEPAPWGANPHFVFSFRILISHSPTASPFWQPLKTIPSHGVSLGAFP
jgi:hypothetical protein